MTSPDYASLTSLLWHTATYQGLSKVNFSSSFPSSQSQLSIPKLWPVIGRKVKAKEKGTAEGRTCNTGLVFTNDIECFLRPRQWFGEKQKPKPGFSLLKHCTMRQAKHNHQLLYLIQPVSWSSENKSVKTNFVSAFISWLKFQSL